MSPEIQTSSKWIGWIKSTANCSGYLVASVPHTANGARAKARDYECAETYYRVRSRGL